VSDPSGVRRAFLQVNSLIWGVKVQTSEEGIHAKEAAQNEESQPTGERIRSEKESYFIQGIDKIYKYINENGSQHSHCQRRELHM
jgi:hypothetical protein